MPEIYTKKVSEIVYNLRKILLVDSVKFRGVDA